MTNEERLLKMSLLEMDCEDKAWWAEREGRYLASDILKEEAKSWRGLIETLILVT